MKKLIFIIFLSAIFTMSCVERKKNVEEEKEAHALDSISRDIETIKTEIEKSSENLDELLNDL